MCCSKRWFIASLVVVLMVAVGAGLLMTVPDMISRLSYAAESGKAEAAREQLKNAADFSLAFQQTAKVLRPSVVTIISVKNGDPAPQRRRPQLPEGFEEFFNDDRFDRFFEFREPRRQIPQRGLGSGVVISEDGYILTNSHVVREADEVTVILSDDRRREAEIVGTDKRTDLAVLKIDATDLVPAQLGDSDAVQVGQWVLAIGSPFELDQSVTAGIISAKGRSGVGVAYYEDFIQTDAAINPGNSGGPLVNLKGEVIGINTAIASRTGGYMGIGFAIPINMARNVKNIIMEKGRVDRGFLGVQIMNLTQNMAESMGFEGTDGAVVRLVTPGGPGEKAGLMPGDIITRFAGRPVRNVNELRNTVADTEPDSTADVVVFREEKKLTLQVTVGLLERDINLALRRPESGELDAGAGISAQPLTPELARRLGYDEDEKGLVVTGVQQGSLGQRAGVRPTDVIVDVNGRPIESLADFREATKDTDSQRGIRMRLKRDGAGLFVFLKGTP